MKVFSVCVAVAVLCFAAVSAAPQNFQDAVRQAQQMNLIPQNSVVDRTTSGIQVWVEK